MNNFLSQVEFFSILSVEKSLPAFTVLYHTLQYFTTGFFKIWQKFDESFVNFSDIISIALCHIQRLRLTNIEAN